MNKANQPEIILRADTGRSVGLGHLVRTCALASMLAPSFRCLVACRNDSPELDEMVEKSIAEAGATRILGDISRKDPESFNESFLRLLHPQAITLLDNYFFDPAFQAEVRGRSKALVMTDDIPDRRFVADVLFTPSPLSAEDFSLAPYTRFYGGPEWAFLRPPFLAAPPSRKKGEIHSAVIGIGGTDPLNLTEKMARLISGLYPSINIDVIAGPACGADLSDCPNVRIHRGAGAGEIASLFDNADFGIFPASTTALEALSRRLPSAVGRFVDNQRLIHAIGTQRGWWGDLGDLRDAPDLLGERIRRFVDGLPVSRFDFPDFSARKEQIINIFNGLWKEKDV